MPTRMPTQEDINYYNSERRRAAAGDVNSDIPGAGLFTDKADLDNAIPAYRHFLVGGGEPRSFDYNDFLSNDDAGKTIRDNVLQDVRTAGDQIYQDLDFQVPETPGASVTFNMQSEAITVGGADSRFAYPATEDWQKTIGGHSIWTGSNITMTRLDDGRLLAEANVTLNAEDRYNFNPNQQDIATGEPDMVRGVLEESGLAHQYTQTGSSELSTSWIIGDPGNTNVPSSGTGGSR